MQFKQPSKDNEGTWWLNWNLATITLWGTWATNVQVVSLASLAWTFTSTCKPSIQIPRSHSWASSLIWNPHYLRPLHIGDDFLGHPNGAVPTPILFLNLVSNHFVIVLFLSYRWCFCSCSSGWAWCRWENSWLWFFSYSSHLKASSLVESTCWTCGLYDGT